MLALLIFPFIFLVIWYWDKNWAIWKREENVKSLFINAGHSDQSLAVLDTVQAHSNIQSEPQNAYSPNLQWERLEPNAFFVHQSCMNSTVLLLKLNRFIVWPLLIGFKTALYCIIINPLCPDFTDIDIRHFLKMM